jgi:hypothetical protein
MRFSQLRRRVTKSQIELLTRDSIGYKKTIMSESIPDAAAVELLFLMALPQFAKLTLFACAMAVVAAPTHAKEPPFWKDDKGNPAPNTEFRSAKDDFGGWLFITPDADWKQKWETSPETLPNFRVSDRVHQGEKLFILIFFSNPKADKQNNVDVTCDIELTRPDGTSSINQKDAVCYRGKLAGNPYNVRLSAPILQFTGEPKDPNSKWILRVVLKDNQRKTALPLKTSFTLE